MVRRVVKKMVEKGKIKLGDDSVVQHELSHTLVRWITQP